MDLSILIPVYNSEKIIENLVKQIIDSVSDIKSVHSYEIILVDDCSSDETVLIADSLLEPIYHCHWQFAFAVNH